MTGAESTSLLAAAQGGDRVALEHLLRVHRPLVYRYGLRFCPTTEDAEDAVQQTLWAAARSIRAYRRVASITTWLFTIVRHYCHRLLPHRAAAPNSTDELLEMLTDERPLPDEVLAATEIRELLASALADLEPAGRAAILLRDFEGLTAPEAAERLGISVPALKSRLHRARELVRQHLAARGVSGPGP